MAVSKYKNVEFMCSRCGTKTTRSATSGRPLPGQCSKSSDKKKPHSWVINRKW